MQTFDMNMIEQLKAFATTEEGRDALGEVGVFVVPGRSDTDDVDLQANTTEQAAETVQAAVAFFTREHSPRNGTLLGAAMLTECVDALLKWAGNTGQELAELSAGIRLDPEMLGQILMDHLPLNRFTMRDKAFWLTVGEYMGPDWIGGLRVVSAFMRKVDEFTFREGGQA